MIKVIIVDDEILAREDLGRLIREDKDFKIVGEAANGQAGLNLIREEAPDVVFLDIEMPRLNGLEVASRLTEWENPPLVVFATAYHQHALKAFEKNAIDYVLKPYDPLRLKKTIRRIRDLLDERVPMRDKLTSLEDYLIEKGTIKKLVGHKRNTKERIVIHPDEVYYFHARYSEVEAHLESQELMVNTTLKQIPAILADRRFAQTHKAYIVNLDKVDKVSPLFSGNFQITLKAPKTEKIPLSRRYARKIKSLLGHW